MPKHYWKRLLGALAVLAACSLSTPALHAAPITLATFKTYIGQGPGPFTSDIGVAQAMWNSTLIYSRNFDLNSLPTAPVSFSLGPSDTNSSDLVNIMQTGNAQYASSITTEAGLLVNGTTYSAGVTNIGEALLYFTYPAQNAAAYTITSLGVTLSDLNGVAGPGASFGYWASFNLQGYRTPPASPVPEPPTLVLLLTGAGLIGLGAWGWRQRQATQGC